MNDNTLNPLNSLREAVILAGLVVAGFTGNYFGVPFYFGVDFLFGSIAVLITVRLYGAFWGGMMALVTGSYTYVLWNHPYTIIIFTCEALFIGLFLHYRKANFILLDCIYWIFIGIPMSGMLHYNLLHMNTTATLLVVLKQGVNGVFNALMANLILTYVPFVSRAESADRKSTSLLETMFNLIVAIVLLTSLMFTVKDNMREKKEVEDEIIARIMTDSDRIKKNLNAWHTEHVNVLTKLAKAAAGTDMTSSGRLQQITEDYKQAMPDLIRLHIDNAEGTSITFAPVFENGKSTLGLSFADRPYYSELRTGLRPVTSNVFMGRVGKPGPILTLGVPVTSGKHFNGYVIGALNLNYIKEQLQLVTDKENMEATVLDSQGLVIASTKDELAAMRPYDRIKHGELRMIAAGVYQWLPGTEKNMAQLVRWQNSLYVRESMLNGGLPWTLVLEVPVAPYQKDMQQDNIQRLASMLVISVLALLIASIMSRLLTDPLNKLATVTTRLPQKLLHRQPVEWPNTFISEIIALVDNFKSMAAILQQNFKALWEEKERAQKLLEQMAFQAHHDPLTGLPNRVLFNNYLCTTLTEVSCSSEILAVMFIDLDEFKMVNDMMGHTTGDSLLNKVSQDLAGCLREQEVLARMGGDEFTILLPRINGKNDAAAVAGKILRLFTQPWLVEGYEFNITASIGIALFPEDGEDAGTLMKHADTAMYRAKEQGRNKYLFFTSEMNESMLKRIALEKELRRAVEKEEFSVYYQPMINTVTGELTGMEALVRWLCPGQGPVYPDYFIPAAEKTGLIVPMGDWVLRTACAKNKAWQDAGYPPVRVTVNISAAQFRQHNIVQKVARILEETGLEPRWLELEITESAAMEDVDFTVTQLREFRKMGIQLAIDDFGTGYSSLNYLKRFPINTLKIDRFFVRDITTNPEDAAIVSAIIVLGQNLNLKVIAEGVETEEQVAFLKQRSCEEMQGYLFGRPVPPEGFEQFFVR